jgi:hypothetical protein
VEIFLVTIGTAKRAPTFQINVAVTNFAPERIVSDKRGSAADKCIRIETYTGIADNCGIEGEKPSPQMTSIKKKKNGVGFRGSQAGRSQGVDVSRYSKGL